MNDKQRTIGFAGTGVMGTGMVRNLMKAGYELHVYTRTKAKAQPLLDEGATWQDTPAQLAAASDVVMTIVGYPQDVEEVYYGEQGLLGSAKPGTVLIDLTTSSPELAQRLAESARERGCEALDAPVSGGDVGAREGRLSIMVGGARETYEQVLPILEAIGQNIVYQGPAGAGQHTKMANQIAIASTMMGVVEAIRYAEKAGLDPNTVLRSIESGAAGSWSLSNLGPRMIKGDFEPGFYVKHIIKDMSIALESAEALGLEAHGLALAKSLYERLASAGEADSGTQALYKLYD
ncbi:NAD(P)-dependent oxidoreductase [Paenibacillus sp. IB182496]|uniref:NAD(P)-dependent oxidoreductase n=1 Tax=Paenibacillus sabuli TaxID=2772509 RepID=A0A927BX78_9BACL|nr:NAD(P)-dependent oxidoreductase [Paenibacillus sabuli]MBD2848546.1 NAD(P)-dependent oxidoreductase [Paenibacillus sabuli]